MVFIACGLNHKTAPIDMREQLASSTEAQQISALQTLKLHADIDEAILLSTCNRTEIYCDASSVTPIFHWLANQYRVDGKKLDQYTYAHLGQQGIKHAIRVSAGLDSMMLGEPQIFGQMKSAYLLAEQQGSIGQKLRPIFHHIFSASKKIRTNTDLGVNPVSVAYAGVRLITNAFNDLEEKSVLLIGAGETSKLVAKYLKNAGVNAFYVANRSLENAKALANELKGTAIPINNLANALENADIIVSATACPLPFISKSLVENALYKTPGAQKLFLDLAVPRDIEPDVATIDGVSLYNVDDLNQQVTENLSQRQQESKKAEEIIDYELNEYINWHRGQRARGIISEYRQQSLVQAESEADLAITLLKNGADPEECIRMLAYRLQQKLAHKPTVGLRQAARNNRQDLIDLATFLFQNDE